MVPGLSAKKLAMVPGLNAKKLALVPGLDAKKLASKPGTISNLVKGGIKYARLYYSDRCWASRK